MGDNHKIYGVHRFSEAGKQLAAALMAGVDEGRNVFIEPECPNKIQTPKSLTLEDFEWTWEEVELAFINGAKAANSLPNDELKFLYGSITANYNVVHDVRDFAGAYHDDNTKQDALEKRFTIDTYKFSVPPHHVDLVADILLWASWIPLASNRHLVWSVVAQKAAGPIKC